MDSVVWRHFFYKIKNKLINQYIHSSEQHSQSFILLQYKFILFIKKNYAYIKKERFIVFF